MTATHVDTSTPITLTAPTTSTESTSSLANQLLDLQVNYFLKKLDQPTLNSNLILFVNVITEHTSTLTLNEIVLPDNVKQAIKNYAFDLNLGSGLLELIGQSSQRILIGLKKSDLTLGEFLGTPLITEIIQKALELEHLHAFIIQQVLSNDQIPALLSLLSVALIKQQSSVYTDSLFAQSKLNQSKLTTSHSKLAKLAKQGLLNKAKEHLESVSLTTARYIEEHTAMILDRVFVQLQQHLVKNNLFDELNKDELEALLINAWETWAKKPLHDVTSALTGVDLEEFFVLTYELWRYMRQVPLMQQLIFTVVDVFFDIYGDETLSDLLEEIGITHTHISDDCLRFIPQLVQALKGTGMVESLLRQAFQGFYTDQNTVDVLPHI